MQTVYEYVGRDVVESRRALARMVNHEFTDGDVDIGPSAGEIRALIRKGMDQPVQCMRSITGAEISFRRCWHHIRARKADARLLYFILQGEMRIVSSAGSYTVKPGRCALINVDEPFYSHAVVGDRGNFECALAVVPEHSVLSHMPWAKGLNTSFELGAESSKVVTTLLDLLCYEGDRLGWRAAGPLTEAFLHSIADSVGEHFASSPRSLADKRFADIQACIRKYVTCTDLTYDRAAALCGISPRYLMYVLKAHDTSFAQLLWGERLPKARDWLVAAAYRRYPIHKIAHMAGFKSAAHFSRMFKSAYGVSPKEYRAEQLVLTNAAECA